MVPPTVLAAFGRAGFVPTQLPGGQGGTWRAGDLVLKPADSLQAARWTADLFAELSGPGFRVPRPVRSVAGDWVAGGWVAWYWLSGEPADWSAATPRWRDLAAASRAFHAALAGVPAPDWLGRDGSPWTVGDQVAWNEHDPGDVLAAAGDGLRAQLGSLIAARRPLDLPAQLVHGDLGGNVLFAVGEPPAVIDFAPYWRPAGLAVAVAAVDALLWSGAGPEILAELADEPQLDQLLARALIYRLVTEIIFRQGGNAAGETGDDEARRATLGGVRRAGQPVTDLVLSRLAGRSRPTAYLDDARLAELAGRAAGMAVTGLRAARAGGHTRAVRRLAQLADGRAVFVKASGPSADVSAEIDAYQAIGLAPFLPQVAVVSRDPVPLLVLEALPADGWVTDWTAEVIASTEELMAEIHSRRAPAGLPRLRDPGATGPRSWLEIARRPAMLLRMQVCDERWLAAHLAALTEAASHAMVAGDGLLHGDVHADNLCYRCGRLVLVDWATAASGAPWFDTHSWLVSMAAEGGPLPDERQGPGAASHAALIAGDQVLRAPSRESDPTLFAIRRERLQVALAWAARLLGLPPPDSSQLVGAGSHPPD